MNKKKIPIYQAKIGLADGTGIFAISFVDSPANESNFVALKKADEVKLKLNGVKQILTGAVLIPDQMIYRNDQKRGEYFISFSAQEIEKISHSMTRNGMALKNTTHQHNTELKGNYLTEVWIVEDPKRDKSVALGMGEYPKGTLMASYKVADPTYWKEQVVTGNVKGFSLEGYFNFNNINMSKSAKPAVKVLSGPKKTNALVSMFRNLATMLEGDSTDAAEAIVDEAAKDETDSGEPVLIFTLADGGEIYVDEDGFCTLDGEQMPAGEHALSDGNTIVIDDAGTLVETAPEGSGEDPAAAPVDDTKLAAARAAGKMFFKKAAAPAKKADTNAAKIVALQAEIAKLKKTPSAVPAKAKVEASKDAPVTYTDKVAQVLADKRARKYGTN